MDEVKKVFITGGTSGIGAAIARAFAATGASVTASGATPAEVEAAQALPANRLIAFLVLDVRQNEQVQNVLGEFGEFDVLVNCAGIVQRGVEHDPEVFVKTVDINLNGTMRACAAARAGLKARQGCIVNTASMLSFFGSGFGQHRRPLCHRRGFARGWRLPDPVRLSKGPRVQPLFRSLKAVGPKARTA